MAEEKDLQGNSILLVEDDPGTCELEAQRLEPLNLDVRRAFGATEAQAALAKRAPELMVIDYSLPGTNALDFIESLRKAGNPVPPFIVVTGRGDEAVAVAAMKAGAGDYIIKNADFLENLLPAVRKALEKSYLLRELEAAQKSTAKNLHLYSFLAQVNLAASQTKDRARLFSQICEIAVTTGGMRMAWIGLPDKDLGRITPHCWAGHVQGYLDAIKIDLGGNAPIAKGPTGTAASTGKIFACPDTATDPSMAPWREKALERGYRSSAAIPLREGGKLAAVLTIYSAAVQFFTDDEVKLLGEIEADISLALDSISNDERRAAAQAALERTSSQLAHVMDVNPVILFTLRRKGEGLITDWVSGNSATLTGYTPEEMLAPNWWTENLHPDDRKGVIDGQKGLTLKNPVIQDFRFRKKDGQYFWVHAQMSVSPNKPGEITGSWTDITRLKESETRFQELFEKAPIGYHSLDENGRLLAVNDTWREVFGYAGEEVLGRSFMEFLAPEERDRFKNNFTAFKLSGKVTDIEYDILRKNGSRGRIKLSARIAHNQDGSFRQTHGIFSDISATWEIERRTKILNEAIKASFNEIYIFDAETFRFIFVNQSALKNLGYSHKEMEELAPWDIKREFQEETFKAAVAPLLKKNQDILLLETVHTRKSGSSYPVEIRLQRIESPDAQVFLAVVNDITERKKSEALITEMTNMQRVESLGALAGGIAHDFNNMLTGIMANLSLLAARKDCGQESTAIIRDTLEASRSAQTLTTQLLAFAKGGKPVKKEFCFDKAITEIVSLATRGAKAAHETEIEAPLWSVNGDENQLKQSLNNLLVNALQAMPDGGTLRVRAANVTLGENTGRLLPPGPYIKVLVSDTGTGIPNEYLNRIFEPYFTTKSRGHGLGLSTTWSVIKNHGGHIEVRSEPGKGSTFEMLLPATGRVLSTAPSVSPEIKKGAGRILILEDEEIVRKAAARMLEELGYSCEITPDGAETLRRYAEEKAAGRPFDAVIMDLTIPGGMGGKDAGPQLRKMDPQARIVVSSGYSDEAVMADYRNFGFDEVLPKPYRYEELAEVLARVTKK